MNREEGEVIEIEINVRIDGDEAHIRRVSGQMEHDAVNTGIARTILADAYHEMTGTLTERMAATQRRQERAQEETQERADTLAQRARDMDRRVETITAEGL